MDPIAWIKLGIAALGCLALYLVAWPIPNYAERLLKERRSKRPDWAEDAFLDYLASEGEQLAAATQRAEPAELEQRIAAYAHSHQLTRSEAMRVLIETGLETEAASVADLNRPLDSNPFDRRSAG